MQENIPLPNFLVIGAQKCGTTWMHYILRQHPKIYIPKCKEIHFFNKSKNYEKDIGWYKSHFQEVVNEKAIGEATPNYFWTSKDTYTYYSRTSNIPELVSHHIPSVKIILILRNPVDRAVSAYYEHIRQGRISPKSKISDVWNKYGIKSIGFYDIHLKRWMNYFEKDQFEIFIFEEDILKDRIKTYKKVYQFLNVSRSFSPDSPHKKKKERKSHLFMRLKHVSTRLAHFVSENIPRVQAIERLARITVGQKERQFLKNEYSSHIDELERMLGRPLPWF